jgi:hypothetical protein
MWVSGDKMSSSLNTTRGTFDALMKRFGVGETNSPEPTNPSSPPFNILDYSKAADHVGAMANDVNTFVSSVNQSVPQLERLSQKVAADTQNLVTHGFRLGLVLIAVLLIGAVLAGLDYRFFAERIIRSAHKPMLAPSEL